MLPHQAGQCVYCNHCLPCPASIDIGQVTRLLDIAELGLTADVKATYHALGPKASDCTKCEACMNRCPFDVGIVSNMEKAASLFK